MSRFSYKTLFIILTLLLVSIVFLLRINQKAKNVSATWWNDTWTYRQRIDVGGVGSTLTDFQINLSVGTSSLIATGKMKSDCSDIRLTSLDNKLLSYWFESGTNSCNTASTSIWVKVTQIPSPGTSIYLYYGNPSATSVSDGNSVFDFFDDFSTNKIGTVWTSQGTTSPTFAGGTLAFTGKQGIYQNTNRQYVGLVWRGLNANTSDNAWYGWNTTAGLNGQGAAGTVRPNQNGFYFGGAGAECNETTPWGANLGDNTWHTYQINWDSTAQNMKLYADGTLRSTSSGCSKTNSRLIDFYHWSGAATDLIDWVGVKKSAPSLPPTSLASEEVSTSPVVFWKLNEGSGTNLYDSTPNQINAYLAGSTIPTWVTDENCPSGKCLYSSGAGYLRVNNTPKLNFGTGSFSVSFWGKAQDYTYPKTFFSMTKANGWVGNVGETGWSFESYSANGVNFQINDGVNKTNGLLTFDSGSRPSDFLNKWVHVTYVIDRTQNKLYAYVNGKKQANSLDISSVTGSISNSSAFAFGTASGWNIQGYFDEVKLYPYARSASQISQEYATALAGQQSSHDNTANFGSNSNKNLSDGLVAYYKMDEGAGTTLTDSTGNLNTANFSAGDSAPVWTTGKYGSGLLFNGSNTSIDSNHTASVGISGNNLTLAAWIKPNSYPSVFTPIIQKGGWVTGYRFMINSSGKVYFGIGESQGGVDTSSTSLPLNTWSHVVTTFDGQTMKIYLNGQLDHSKSWTSPIPGNIGLINLGKSEYPALDGSKDEIRIYNRTLSSDDVKQLYDYLPGPISHYRFDEGSGSSALDSSGKNNSMSFGAGASAPTWTTGKIGKSLQYSSGAYSQLSNFLNLNNDFTISFWSKGAETGAWRWFINMNNYGTGTTGGLTITTNSNKVRWSYGNWFTEGVTGTTTVLNNTNWYYITVGRQGNKLFTYLNGIPEGVGTTTSVTNMSLTAPIMIGRGPNYASDFYLGQLDDLKIYNYARTPQQVLQDMQADSSSSTRIEKPIVWYKFDEGVGSALNNSGVGGPALNGVFGNGNSAPTWVSAGKNNRALSFDGTYSTVRTNNPGLLNYTGLTVSVWIKSDNIAANQNIISQNGPFFLQLIGGKVIGRFYGGTWTSTPGGQTLQSNTWYHLVMTYDQSNIKVYINGVLDNQTAKTGIFTGSTVTYLGMPQTAGYDYPFSGLMDDLKIYNHALSDKDIKQDYNQSSSFTFGTSNQNIGATTISNSYCIPGDTSPCLPPVGEWKFEEGAGTSAFDTSGNNNNGLLSGTTLPVWTPGKIGKGLSFNGGYLNAGNGASLNTPNALTLEAWVKPESSDGNWNSIISKSAKSAYYLMQRDASQSFSFGVYLSGTLFETSIPTTDIVLNRWQHISATYDGAKIAIYLNGILKSSKVATGTVSNIAASNLYLGSSTSTSEFFQGDLDNILIYNYARTPAQIAYDFNGGAPAGWWKLDDCQGTVANDSSGFGSAGTISIGASGTQNTFGTCSAGTSAAWTNGSSGKFNSALSFDGTDDYLSIGPTMIYSPNQLSVSVWFKTSSTNQMYLLRNRGYGYGLYLNANGSVSANVYESSTTSLGFTSTTGYNDSKWHQAILTYNGTVANLYLDGKLTKTQTGSGTNIIYYSGNYVGIGRDADSSNSYYSGLIDDVRIYTYALNQQQINSIYNNGGINFTN